MSELKWVQSTSALMEGGYFTSTLQRINVMINVIGDATMCKNHRRTRSEEPQRPRQRAQIGAE